MVFSATFNNISVISWRSVLLVEETEVPGENHWTVPSHCQTVSHNVVSSTPCHEWGLNSQCWKWLDLSVHYNTLLVNIHDFIRNKNGCKKFTRKSKMSLNNEGLTAEHIYWNFIFCFQISGRIFPSGWRSRSWLE